MTVTEMPTAGQDYSRALAAEVRAMLARREINGRDIARALGVSPMYVSRRYRGQIPWDAAELAVIAGMARCRVSDLLPRQDSNLEPAGSGTTGYGTTGYQVSMALAA